MDNHIEHDEGEQAGVVIHNAEQITILTQLRTLIDDTNTVLSHATMNRFDDESIFDANVNWVDLSCVGARRWIDEEGTLGWQVDISEADPDNNGRFKAYVASHLSNRGWENVIVQTEW